MIATDPLYLSDLFLAASKLDPSMLNGKSFLMNNSSLDSSRLEALGFNGLFSAEKGLSHTVKILKAALQ